MNHIIDLLRLMRQNYSTDIIYFENLIEKETGKYVEIHIENDKIIMYHKVTCCSKGEYMPSDKFTILANAFITLNKPALKLKDINQIMEVFSEFNIKKQII